MIDKKGFINAPQDAMPKVLADADDAERAMDAVFMAIDRGLKNGDTVELHGIGEFRVEPGPQGKDVVLAADRRLMDSINE
ncbi:HU family DNA-binding protein [Desulfohalovibrio reitneri]|uniref:HU family DNA-binding protein n=1 Tax=Desulfohalovibrio reitneri TaxID=1307759 RepID=UPI000552C038|nr:HU family DNA-binding protein [Desulfohalovibrio reitneri]